MKIVIYLFAEYIEQTLKVYLCHSEFRSLTGKRRFRRQSASVSGWTDTTGNSSGLATITRVVFTAAGGDGTRGDFHTHTHLSDGEGVGQQRYEKGSDDGFGFLCANRT